MGPSNICFMTEQTSMYVCFVHPALICALESAKIIVGVLSHIRLFLRNNSHIQVQEALDHDERKEKVELKFDVHENGSEDVRRALQLVFCQSSL